MAAGDLAAKRYSLAAFELAMASKSEAEWRHALDQIGEFMSDPEVRAVLENTRVPQDSKQRLVLAALGDLPRLALNLARLLVRKDRTALASQIAEQFRQLVETEEGIAHAKASTAVALSDAERAALIRQIAARTGREIILETDVDPSLLGGVVVQIGDRLIDGSTRARLEALRASLAAAV